MGVFLNLIREGRHATESSDVGPVAAVLAGSAGGLPLRGSSPKSGGALRRRPSARPAAACTIESDLTYTGRRRLTPPCPANRAATAAASAPLMPRDKGSTL